MFNNKSLLDIHPNAITNIRYTEGCPDKDNSKFCIQFRNIGKNRCMEVVWLSSLAHNHYQETCVICEDQKQKGIHLYTSFICTDCEEDLIQTETHDPKYKYYLKQLKKITTPEIFS